MSPEKILAAYNNGEINGAQAAAQLRAAGYGKTAAEQRVIQRLEAEGSSADKADRPFEGVPDWELIAAYRSGNVVNGVKVTQELLIAELRARKASDAEITAAIQPGTLAETLQEGAGEAAANAVKANQAIPEAKYDGPTAAEI